MDVLVACCHLASGWPVVDRKLIIFANELLEYKFRQPFEIPISRDLPRTHIDSPTWN